LLLTGFAFYVNNNLVPKAALEAYSLLYDIKQKKPALDLREGTFYNGIPDISIKVDTKFPDDQAALKGIVVYDHRKNDGNKEVTKADSGRMYTILNERYLKFELFNGYNYTEGGTEEQSMVGQSKKNANKRDSETLTRSRFYKTEVVFDLSSFDLKTTDKKWFQGNRIMRNLSELDYDIDSIRAEVLQTTLNHYLNRSSFFSFFNKVDEIEFPEEIRRFKEYKDSIKSSQYVSDTAKIRNTVTDAPLLDKSRIASKRNSVSSRKKVKNRILPQNRMVRASIGNATTGSDSSRMAKLDSVFNTPITSDLVQAANNRARQSKNHLANNNTSIENYQKEQWVFEIQWHKILASSMACIAMFLIGAPLGAIIKKGGLGVPFLVSIFFFIVYYLLSMQGEKLAKQGAVSALVGVWAADLILLGVGLVFLRQARIDARLFELDFYRVVFDKLRQWRASRRKLAPKVIS
jgi:lipopolysaccharide export system permease protein